MCPSLLQFRSIHFICARRYAESFIIDPWLFYTVHPTDLAGQDFLHQGRARDLRGVCLVHHIFCTYAVVPLRISESPASRTAIVEHR